MRILALESSTSQGSVALLDEGELLTERVSLQLRSHSEVLNVFVEEILRETQTSINKVDLIAVGQGPGSFTGIRVAANIGRTFAYAFNKPLVSFDSLINLAAQAPKDGKPVVSMINAQKNMVYLGIFDNSTEVPRVLTGPAAYSVRELHQVVSTESWVVGDGWKAFSPYFRPELSALLIRPENPNDFPSAMTLGTLAYRAYLSNQTMDWKSFQPLYIRASEAEENKKGIKIQPLT